jgi:hypothetical protein
MRLVSASVFHSGEWSVSPYVTEVVTQVIRVMAIPDKGGEWGAEAANQEKLCEPICFPKLTLKRLTFTKTPTSTTRSSN